MADEFDREEEARVMFIADLYLMQLAVERQKAERLQRGHMPAQQGAPVPPLVPKGQSELEGGHGAEKQ
jgi:hypothetical protein